MSRLAPPRSTTGCRVLRLPQRPTFQLPLDAASSGCAGTEPPTRVDCSALRLDRRPTSPARIGVLSFSSTGGEPPTRAGCFALPIDRWRPIRLSSNDPSTGKADDQLPIRTGLDPSARLVEQPPAFTGCCCSLQLAPTAAATSSLRWLLPPSPNRRRTSDSHRLFHPPASPVSIHSACAECLYLRLGL